MKKNFYKKKVSLLLLCNIDPKNVIHAKRKNIQDKIQELISINYFVGIIK